MLDVDKLATFRAVVRHGSFSAAARELHLTQPAVSRQVALLERRLGTRLVRRTQRGIRITEAGRLLLRHTETVLAQLATAEWEIAELTGARTGTVRLGSFFTALVRLSADLAVYFGEHHPGLTIADDLVDRADALDKLTRGALDVAIIFELPGEPSGTADPVRVVELFDDPLTVLLPAGHELAREPEIPVTALRDQTWIRGYDGAAARLIDRVLATAGFTPPVRLAGHGDEPIELQALVAAGAGITLAHRLNVVLEPTQVAVRPLTGVTEYRRIQAAYAPGDAGPVVTTTLDCLQAIATRYREG